MEYNLLDLMESSHELLGFIRTSDAGFVGYPSCSVEWNTIGEAVEITLSTYDPFPEEKTVATVAQGQDDAALLLVLGMLVENHASKFTPEEPNAQEPSIVSD